MRGEEGTEGEEIEFLATPLAPKECASTIAHVVASCNHSKDCTSPILSPPCGMVLVSLHENYKATELVSILKQSGKQCTTVN